MNTMKNLWQRWRSQVPSWGLEKPPLFCRLPERSLLWSAPCSHRKRQLARLPNCGCLNWTKTRKWRSRHSLNGPLSRALQALENRGSYWFRAFTPNQLAASSGWQPRDQALLASPSTPGVVIRTHSWWAVPGCSKGVPSVGTEHNCQSPFWSYTSTLKSHSNTEPPHWC